MPVIVDVIHNDRSLAIDTSSSITIDRAAEI
jgi:hypothetical protein